jgi:hypothetical protein
MLTIQQTMVDAGAIPMAWGIAVCLGNGPTDLPTDHAAEVCEAGPSGVSQIPRWESLLNHTMDATSHSTISR